MTGIINSIMPSASAPTALISGIRGQKAINTATNQQVNSNKEAQGALQPYMTTGTQANTALQNDLSNGSLGGTFSPGDLTKEPGYNFALTQGQQALDRRAAGPGGGGYFSGQALKEAQTFGQGLADQTYNDAYNRWLQQQQNTYNILSGQQKQGLDAATNYGTYSTNIGSALASGEIAKQNNTNNMISGVLGGLKIK